MLTQSFRDNLEKMRDEHLLGQSSRLHKGPIIEWASPLCTGMDREAADVEKHLN